MPEEKALATVNKDLIAKLRENSGEADVEQAPFIPIFQVDNKKEKTDVGGREVDILCKPRWKRTDKKGDEYAVTNIESFGGVILRIMWQVVNNGKWDPAQAKMVPNGAPYFTSPLFNPTVLFGKKLLTIKYSGDNGSESLTYPELKAKYGKEFQLIGWVFVLFNNELVRLKMTGSSRSAVFDYPKEFKGDDSISAHNTIFSAKYDDKPQPHNVAVFTLCTDDSIKYDADMVVEYGSQLSTLFNSQASKVIEAIGGEVVSEDGDINVEQIPFD
jgi:hypothetical protein